MTARQKLGYLVGKKFGPIQIRSTLGPADPLAELKRELQRLYAITVVARQEFAELGAKGRFPPLRRLKRLCQRLADLARKSPPLTGALAMYYGGKVHAVYHPVNVAILSLLIGQQLGLGRSELITLALAALIHDVGMDDRHGRQGNSPAPESVRMLIEHKGLNEQMLQWTVTADELAYYCGYLPGREKWYHGGEGPGPYAQIISTCHLFERLVNGDPDQAVSPHTAVLQLLDGMTRKLDARVVKAFVSLFGLFPVGTVVQLTDGAKAVVVRNYEQAEMISLPAVRPIPGHAGKHDPDKVLELGDPGVRVKIATPLTPAQLRVNVLAEVYA
jgi:hypothetical protein